MPTKKKVEVIPEPGEKVDMIAIMEARMSGTKDQAATSILSYKDTAKRFLKFVGRDGSFQSQDIDRYMKKRREEGISKSTQRKEFFHIKALAITNKIEWAFDKYDIPRVKEKPLRLTLNPDQLEQIILKQNHYSKAERFYLMIATTFACRREAMAQMIKRDYDRETITIRGVHGGETIKHAIPDVFIDLLTEYWPGQHKINALSKVFNRIVQEAGLKLDRGYGWHSIRRCVTSCMVYILPKTEMDLSLWAEFTGWAKASEGASFMNSSMMGYYTHPEVLDSDFMRRLKVLTSDTHDNDAYWLDHSIYLVHPFLRVWEKALKAHPVVKLGSQAIVK